MTKFGSYYNLCPLSDIKGLQGVSPDREDGIVIVTYRRNLAIRYRIHDQRQIHSWRTKESFSSPVVWCENLQKYFAVFGERYVRCWSGDDEYLDKMKKQKFNHNINILISTNQQCFVVFTNGTVLPLELAVTQREVTTPSPLTLTGDVQEVIHCTVGNTVYIGMTLTSEDSSFKFAWASFGLTKEDSGTFELDRSSVAQGNVRVVGSVLTEVEGDVCLLLLWSDGRLFQVDLHTVEASTVDVCGSAFQIFTNTLAMISLGDSQQHIAIFGEASAGEGSLLALYGVRTRHVGPTLALKVRGDSRSGGLWHCNGDKILVHVGQNLVVVPALLAKQELAHLLGVDENVQEVVEQAQIVTQLDLANSNCVVDLDEDVVVHLLEEALPNVRDVLQIISKSAVNDQRLTRALRKHLSFTASVELFKHLITYLSDLEEVAVDVTVSVSDKERCVVWATCLLDANYQQLAIASSDQFVSAVLVHFCDMLKAQRAHLQLLRELEPMIRTVVSKGRVGSDMEQGERSMVGYSVEKIDLYSLG